MQAFRLSFRLCSLFVCAIFSGYADFSMAMPETKVAKTQGVSSMAMKPKATRKLCMGVVLSCAGGLVSRS